MKNQKGNIMAEKGSWVQVEKELILDVPDGCAIVYYYEKHSAHRKKSTMKISETVISRLRLEKQSRYFIYEKKSARQHLIMFQPVPNENKANLPLYHAYRWNEHTKNIYIPVKLLKGVLSEGVNHVNYSLDKGCLVIDLLTANCVKEWKAEEEEVIK